MGYERKNEIPSQQMDVIIKIGKRLKELRNETGLSIERLCSEYHIPRITYGNIEKSKGSFQITTLMTILEIYKKDIKTFFQEI